MCDPNGQDSWEDLFECEVLRLLNFDISGQLPDDCQEQDDEGAIVDTDDFYAGDDTSSEWRY